MYGNIDGYKRLLGEGITSIAYGLIILYVHYIFTVLIMIDSVRIENLRSLRDTGFVKLKKLNILLGSNSSGKVLF